MNKSILLTQVGFTILCWLITPACYAQPKSGQFIYQLISHEIIDSSRVSPEEVTSIIGFMKLDFYAEIYYNKTWVVALQKRHGGSVKSMYNRKSRVLFTYYDERDNKRLRIDSIQALKRNDKVLLAAIDTLQSDLQVIEYPKETRLISEFQCHKVTIAEINFNPPTLDEIWIAKFANVPDLIFPWSMYFLIEGIPLEIVQDFGDIKFKWGVVDILPVKSSDNIFTQKNDGYEISVADTKKLIYECIHFIRTYEPKQE